MSSPVSLPVITLGWCRKAFILAKKTHAMFHANLNPLSCFASLNQLPFLFPDVFTDLKKQQQQQLEKWFTYHLSYLTH